MGDLAYRASVQLINPDEAMPAHELDCLPGIGDIDGLGEDIQ